jgi:glycine hydroxymethyltransferase
MIEWTRHPLVAPGAALRDTDPEIAALITDEIERQQHGLELIASENFVSPAVLEAMGSPRCIMFAVGLRGKRYYGG